MDREPKSGEVYRHFKNRLYQIIAVAVHSETAEKLVIYQAMYGDFQVYARPLEMFMSEVDRRKYPQVQQRYRFEQVDRSILSGEGEAFDAAPREGFSRDKSSREKSSWEEPSKELGSVDAKLMAFLDTDDWEMKYNIVVSMRDDITDHMINNLAVSIDVVIPEGDLSDRYEQLKSCIRTKQRYERERMR